MTLWKGPSGALSPHCLGDGVNDDLPFCGRKTSDWSRRVLSIRQACQGTTSWTGSQILGRSLEYANCLSNISLFQYKHLPNPPNGPFPFHKGEGEIFLHLRNKVTARNNNYQDLGHFKNIPQYAPPSLAWESQGDVAYCCSRVCNAITKAFIHRRLPISQYLRLHLRLP